MPASLAPSGYLGSSFPAPTDPQYYLGSSGLSSLVPQAFNANSLSAMFAPQGMQYTPENSMATNPFMQMYLNAAGQALHGQRPGTGPYDPNSGQQNPAPMG